jgi:hypothetical protein
MLWELTTLDPISPQSGSLTLEDEPKLNYTAEFWDTYTGKIDRTEKVSADAAEI